MTLSALELTPVPPPSLTSKPLHPHPDTHHNGPQHLHKGADPLSVFDEGLPQRLLLSLFQQDVFVADVLHGAVQLGLDVSTAWRTQVTKEDTGGAAIRQSRSDSNP